MSTRTAPPTTPLEDFEAAQQVASALVERVRNGDTTVTAEQLRRADDTTANLLRFARLHGEAQARRALADAEATRLERVAAYRVDVATHAATVAALRDAYATAKAALVDLQAGVTVYRATRTELDARRRGLLTANERDTDPLDDAVNLNSTGIGMDDYLTLVANASRQPQVVELHRLATAEDRQAWHDGWAAKQAAELHREAEQTAEVQARLDRMIAQSRGEQVPS